MKNVDRTALILEKNTQIFKDKLQYTNKKFREKMCVCVLGDE